jgi:CBS domain-containing protein
MEEDVVTVQPDTPVPTVTAQMETEDVGAVVVVDDNEPQSVVTDREVALALGDMPDLADKTAEDLISDEMVTGEQQMSVYEALQQLSEENIRRLPIVDENGDLIGIVTLDDIIVLIGEEMQDAADIIQTQSPRL